MSNFENYKIKSRSESIIKQYGSIESALNAVKAELKEYESNWSRFSSECLGHAITCNRLIVDYLTSLTQTPTI